MATAQTSMSVKRGSALKVRYVITKDAKVTFEVRKGSSTIKRIKQSAQEGRNTVKIKMSRTGKFTLKTSARSSDGQTASDKADLTVKKP